jgi:Polyketide cyclase / dehydrase and lipid transport
MTDQVSVQRDIAASSDELWARVSDVTRMGELSPESAGGQWIGGATGPAVGARFKGKNQNGKKRWSTVAKITDCEPGRVFAFEVSSGPLKVARWEYRFEPTDTGTTVTETWIDQRGRIVTVLGKPVSGVADRASHNRTTMEATLAALAETTS